MGEHLSRIFFPRITWKSNWIFGGPTIAVEESDSGSAGLTGKRPLGRDSCKSERKKVVSSSSTEYLSRLQDLTEKQIQCCIEKGEKKDKFNEQDRELENKMLDLEAKKLSICERELRFEELRSAKEQLQMLECTREEEVDPEVWTMMKEHKKHLQQFIFSFR
jgi:hypothetical protein